MRAQEDNIYNGLVTIVIIFIIIVLVAGVLENNNDIVSSKDKIEHAKKGDALICGTKYTGTFLVTDYNMVDGNIYDGPTTRIFSINKCSIFKN